MDTLIERGFTICDIVSDRAYNMAKADTWTLALAERAIDAVFDLAKRQRGTHPGKKTGTILIDGTLFADSLPKHLRHLPSHHEVTGSAETLDLTNLYDKRMAFAYKPMQRNDGRTRYRGPIRADRVNSRIRCANYPYSLRAPQDRPTTTCTAGEPCGCGGTVTLEDNHFPNIRQRNAYGTTAWHKDYHRRNLVETANSQIRLPGALRRGYTRVFGRIKNALLIGFTIFAHNHHCIVNFYRARSLPIPNQFTVIDPVATESAPADINVPSRNEPQGRASPG